MVQKNTVSETNSNGLNSQVTLVSQGSVSNSTYEFNIVGVPYRLKTHHETRTIENLVGVVQQKMELAIKATRSGSYQNAAVLTALQLAEEIMNLKQNAQNQIAEIESQLSNLKSKLELLEHRDHSNIIPEIIVSESESVNEFSNADVFHHP
ncbi:MAG: cell division protein ZapA [Pseudobdellovibrionaceae bacterium]